jgi:fucose permease
MRAALQAWAVESTPREMAGSGVAIQFGIQAAGAAFAPAIFGMVADAYSLQIAFLVIAGTIVFANVLILFMPDGAAKPAATSAA